MSKAAAAKMIAGQVGVKDKLVLNLIGYLADAKIEASQLEAKDGVFRLPAKIDGLELDITFTGRAAVYVWDKIKT